MLYKTIVMLRMVLNLKIGLSFGDQLFIVKYGKKFKAKIMHPCSRYSIQFELYAYQSPIMSAERFVFPRFRNPRLRIKNNPGNMR